MKNESSVIERHFLWCADGRAGRSGSGSGSRLRIAGKCGDRSRPDRHVFYSWDWL